MDQRRSVGIEMAQSGNARAFEADDEFDGATAVENDTACPVCGSQSRSFYSDRYGSYEFCKDCGWSDDGPAAEEVSEERGGRRDRGRRGGGGGGRDEDY
jgi:hypothetical protein